LYASSRCMTAKISCATTFPIKRRASSGRMPA
jgi:hypothetical protein